MKSFLLIITLILGILFPFNLQGQAPQKFNYQTVVRDQAGLLKNQLVQIRFSIINHKTSNIIYQETHVQATNDYGLVNLIIGEGTVDQGNFPQILWGTSLFDLKVELDTGMGFNDMGTTALVSVPYSLYAEKARKIDTLYLGEILDVSSITPAIDEVLKWNGSEWIPASDNVATGGGAVNTSVRFTGDGTPANPLDIAQQGASNGQTLKWNGNAWVPDNDEFNDPDSDPTNEIQNLSLNGLTLSLSQGGGSVNLPSAPTYSAGSGISITGMVISNTAPDQVLSLVGTGASSVSGTYPNYTINSTDNVNDADADPNNEIQTLSLTGSNLSLSQNGGTVGLPTSPWNSMGSDIHYDQGLVGIGVSTPAAPFHIGEGKTVVFGADTMGKSNFFPDPKMMFLPGKGGAFRVGQLNADGSIIGGTGFNFWDPANIGWASVAIGNNTKATGAGSVALGIRSYAGNFGSVALGHLSRTLGNSAVSAGYYTRADAFVSTAVGAGNVGGGSNNSWVATDPIFEVGNSIDTTNRSNAFTVMKNGRVGINHHNPQSMLDIDQPNQGPGNGILLNLSGYGHWETGVDYSSDYNFYYNNSLKAYILDSDGSYITTSDRRLKENITGLGSVLPLVLKLRPSTYRFKGESSQAKLSYGFIAQEIEPLFPDFVHEKEGIKSIGYSNFGVIAIKAIQEQQEMIQTLQEQIIALEKRLEQMEKK